MTRKRHLRWIILASLLFLGGTIAFYLLRSPRYGLQVGGLSVTGTDADLQIDRVHMVQNKKGRKDWELWADSAKVYREKNVTHLENLRVRFYPRKGKPIDVNADRGLMENQSRNMRISGNVLIRTADGITVRTDSLHFRPKEKRIDTDGRIVFQGGSFRLTGVGLHGRTDLGQFSLKESVQAVIHDAGSLLSSQAANPVRGEALPERERGAPERRSP